MTLAVSLLAQASAYTVQRGDTLSSIARRHDISVQALMELNDLHSTTIWPGQQLQTGASKGVDSPATPVQAAERVFQTGKAVYYGGRADAQTTLTAAHLTLPFGTWVKVTHGRTGRSVTVKINDRGPFNGGGRIIDLSTAAARELGILSEGVAPVSLSLIAQP